MTESTRENEKKVKPLAWWERLFYVFTKPDKVFENLKEYPKVLFPIIFTIIGLGLLSFLRIDLFKEFYINEIYKQYAAKGLDMPGNIETLAQTQAYITVILAGVMPILIWLIKSALVHGIAGLGDGEATFKHSFSVIAHSYLPVILGSVIVTIISLAINRYNVITSFAVLLPKSMEGGFLYNLLANIDIFIIWYQILAVIGISKAYEISRKRAAFAVLGTWLSWVLISTGMTTIATALMNR
jgi:hypothetical protein